MCRKRDLVKHVVVNGVKIGIALVASAAAFEVGSLGAAMTMGDVDAGIKATKHQIDPEPVYMKKGRFGKKKVVTVNPVTGKVSDYKGTKTPTKTIRVK